MGKNSEEEVDDSYTFNEILLDISWYLTTNWNTFICFSSTAAEGPVLAQSTFSPIWYSCGPVHRAKGSSRSHGYMHGFQPHYTFYNLNQKLYQNSTHFRKIQYLRAKIYLW